MHNVRKAHGDKVILDNVTLSFLPGAKIGVVGPNGAGKSSVLKIMAGLDIASNGDAMLAPGYSVGILLQEPPLEELLDVRGNVDIAVKPVKDMVDRFNEIAEKMAVEYTDELGNEMGVLQDQIDHAGGWDLDSRIEMAMDALRLPPGDADVTLLSGGERRRVALCKLLLQQPDLLLLDEPTNHLDALARIEGLRWLRFLYAYPNRITGKLLEAIALHDNICKYLDVPLQHASPDVLKRMKRGAGADIFLKTVEKVRAAVPGIALRTSFIVGFPGESQTDFETLEQFITAAKFDWLGVFNYSDEEGSKAHALDSKLHKRTIESRKRRLMKLQQKISKQAKQQWVGRELVILAEGESSETELLWEGRTEFHAPEIDGKVFINDFGDLANLEAGKFYRAEITEAHDYDLVARITSGPL
jgi:ABC-type cobalamin/Fe3+-siderophores transport system ATPase subunit